jgi:ferrous iron transport protein B
MGHAHNAGIAKAANPQDHKNSETIVLIGNPNVGKSIIFNFLTGKYVNVSNYPGTTVEITRGIGKLSGEDVTFIDTPGTNGFVPVSEDEKVTRDILLDDHVTSVLQVGDAKNLRRVLTLSLQLAEMEIPFILNLNMMDELGESGNTIDLNRLEETIGVPINTTVAVRREGTQHIRKHLLNACKSCWKIKYPEIIEKAIIDVTAILPEVPISKRAMSLLLLMEDEGMKKWVKENLTLPNIERIQSVINSVEQRLRIPISYVVAQARFREVDRLCSMVIRKKRVLPARLPAFIESSTRHPLWGIPFLILSLLLMYIFVGFFGAQILVDFFENTVFGKFINPSAKWLFEQAIPFSFIHDLFVGEYGIITMAVTYGFAIVFPIVTTFFLVFSFFEDSGYLPRIAFLLNRFFRLLGLNGKAVLPMILGLGCDTMASMSTRILESQKERRIAIFLLALGVPCSAQLGVILGMTAMLPWQATLLWISVVSAVMIIVGSLSAKFIPGDISDFILELPPLRFPLFSNIVVKTIARIVWYIKEILPVFVFGTLILFVLDKMSILPIIMDASSPLIQNFLGLPVETTEAFLIGFLRRDYGAAGLFHLANQGGLTGNQIVVSIVTITLFMPCIANLLVIIKELGFKSAVVISAIILPLAFLIGGLLNIILTVSGVSF